MPFVFFKNTVKLGGVKRVVKITIITITEKTESETTPNCFPIIAKISPTSPLGTMPKPIKDLLTPLPAANPETYFPTNATKEALPLNKALQNLE